MTLLMPEVDTLAAIDIGTNSIHMVIARVGEGHSFEIIDREKEMVRLGSGGGDMKELETAAMDRGVAALGRFRQIADSHGAAVVAVATSAVREAANAGAFLERARDEAGIEVEVVSGFEEARLIHLGVLQALPVVGRRHLVVDIGGGSTEIVVAEGVEPELTRSLKLGAIRLTRRFFRRSRVSDEEVEECRRFVRATFAPVLREADGARIEVAVGSSGTIESVAAMIQAARGGDPPRTFNGFELSRKELRRTVRTLVEVRTVDDRKAIPGLDPKRADIILAGTVILEEVMRGFSLPTLVLSEYALREGVLLDAIERARGSASHHLHDLRRRSVLHLAELCDDDPAHSAHVARLALELFDGVAGALDLDEHHRELLEAAALLANVGIFISHAQHHHHSYYVIRSSEHLLGFTDHEIELIAQVARYHRKSPPRDTHPAFEALDPGDRELVRRLAGILRVALALDRGHTGSVEAVSVGVGGERVQLTITPARGDGLELELYTARERSGLLREVLGREVHIEVVAPEGS